MKGSADIDVILLLNFQPQEDMKGLPRAKEILILIQSLVPKGYTAKMNKRSVTVSKNSTTRAPMNSWLSTMMGQQTHHSMDIVPALRRVGQGQKPSTWWYGVSKVSGPAQWLRFNPTHQKEMFSKLTKRSNQKDDPTTVIICLKHWRNHFRNPPCKLPSYVFEVLTWEDYRSYPSENDLTKRFNRILKNFKRIHNQGISFHGTMSGSHKPNDSKVAKGTPLLHDPSNTSQNLVKHLRKEDLEWWSAKSSASGQLRRYISFCFEGVVNLRRRLIRVYADVENAVGMPPEKLRNHIQNNIGDASTNFAFLAKRNQDALGEQWRAAGFKFVLLGMKQTVLTTV